MSTATVGVPYRIAFYSPYTGLTVTAKVFSMDTGTSWDLTLTESASLSTTETRVYINTFTPTAPGWFVIHYLALSAEGTLVKTDITRLEAVLEVSTDLSNPSVTSQPIEDGVELIAPAVIGDLTGVLTFSVRS